MNPVLTQALGEPIDVGLPGVAEPDGDHGRVSRLRHEQGIGSGRNGARIDDYDVDLLLEPAEREPGGLGVEASALRAVSNRR